MTDKNSFTPDEWATLGQAPALTALAVTVAGSSGLFGTLAEAMGMTGALIEGAKSDNPLIRALCQKEELAAAQKGLREKIQALKPGDLAAAQAEMRTTALDSVRKAMQILAAKGTPADVAAYRTFITDIGKRVANAAKEGGFLGFGGERVSEGERGMLASIEAALGAARV
ncbi:MAG TPA: hypothetical protein VNM87_08895 [Candidatus Udaeobacter sp.]|nr:hypothetical protein [Candidatus Udaeobacter sp.]